MAAVHGQPSVKNVSISILKLLRKSKFILPIIKQDFKLKMDMKQMPFFCETIASPSL